MASSHAQPVVPQQLPVSEVSVQMEQGFLVVQSLAFHLETAVLLHYGAGDVCMVIEKRLC